ncbi:MAG: polysaccharide deacetylase family protein [candidate division WOR-3 bacterium]
MAINLLLLLLLSIFPQGRDEPKIALLRSTHTQSALPELSEWMNDNLADWEVYLLNRRLGYRVITSRELEKGIEGYDLLILPSAICLSERERSAIRRFLSGGGGVLATGPLGARDEQGGWQGWEFLSSLFGVEVTGEIGPKGNVSASLTLKGNSPLSYRIPPGFRLEVTNLNEIHPLAAKVVETRASPVGYWSKPLTSNEKGCGVVCGEYYHGRFVWLGFEREAVVGVKTIQVIRDQILLNSISWLRKEPVAWLNPWPDGKRENQAAVVLICDAEYRYTQTLNAVTVLNKEGVQGTFFLVPEEALNNPKATRILTENGEIGLHGVEVYRWQPYEEQLSRLKEGRESLEELTGKKIIGFHPPEELYDSSTIKALAELGYRYLCGNDVTDRLCPLITQVRSSSLRGKGEQKPIIVVLPKGPRSDYDLLVKEHLRGTNDLFDALKQDFLSVYEVQGAYFLLYHSHLLCAENNIPALERFIQFCKGKDVWFATCKEMADWWQGFENLSLTVRRANSSLRRIEVKVTNNSQFPLKNLRLFVAPPEPVKNVSIKSRGVVAPEYELKEAGRIITFNVKSLGAYASQTYLVDCQ